MLKLLAGLIAFHGIHLLPVFQAQRARFKEAVGNIGYQVVFAVLSFAGLYLMAKGYGELRGLPRQNPTLYTPPAFLKHIAYLLMLPAFILMAAAYIPSRIRTAAKHPMLASIKLWALAHLLVRGDLASVLLFGSFLAYGVIDRISVKKRGAMGPLGDRTGNGDAIVLALGIGAYLLMFFWGHAYLIGIPVR
ncbi:MAG: hypothetical protein RL291_1783 [Pseudomonadota bacterium]|jgi:uncharacterized membrane protein